METTKSVKESVDMKLEVVVLGVSDVDRAKACRLRQIPARFCQAHLADRVAEVAKPGVGLSNLAFLSNCRDFKK